MLGLIFSLGEMTYFLEHKFQDTLTEENKVIRSPGVRDTHIHCVFLLLDPTRLDANIATRLQVNASNGNSSHTKSLPSNSGALDEIFDLHILRTLQGKTTVIPVISKADTITSAHMAHLKRAVYDSIERNNLDTLAALGLDDGETTDDQSDTAESNGQQQQPHFVQGHDRSESNISHLDSPTDSETSFSASTFDLAHPWKTARKQSSASSAAVYGNGTTGAAAVAAAPAPAAAKTKIPYIPMSIIAPDLYEPDVIGRKFPWGFADPNNEEHCDFPKLKDLVFSDWRAELRDASRVQWYEGWRSERLNRQSEKEVSRVYRNRGGAKTFGGIPTTR